MASGRSSLLPTVGLGFGIGFVLGYGYNAPRKVGQSRQ